MNATLVLALFVAAAPGAPDEEVHVQLRETVRLPDASATAAFALQSDIVEASAGGGYVTLHARSPGRTVISVVSAAGVRTFEAVVDAPTFSFAPSARTSGQKLTRYEAYYQSQTGQLAQELEVLGRESGKGIRAHLLNALYFGPQRGTDARVSFPVASLELSMAERTLVLLDAWVKDSPLTLDGTSVRGLHYQGDGLEVHAGVTSPLLYQSFLLTEQRELVFGASYRFAFGRSALAPHLYYYPGPALGGGAPGAAGSMVYTYGRPDDSFRLRGELGYGKRIGAALELGYDGSSDRVWFDGRHQPRGYASLGLSNPHGTFADGGWSHLLIEPLMLTLTGSLNRHELSTFTQSTAGGGAELRYAFSTAWAVAGAAQLSWVRTSESPETIRTLTLPLTVTYQGPQLGLTAQARYQRHSQRNRGGPGARLGATYRVLGGLNVGLHADWQRDAATVDLVFREVPGLEQTFTELGISAADPTDLARLLRENPALAELGYLEGAQLNLNPWRFQSGAHVAWTSQDVTRQMLRLQLLFDETRSVLGLRRTGLASLSYSIRAVGSLDALANLTGWTQRTAIGAAQLGWSYGVGIRWRIDDVPRISALLAQPIEGRVFGDERASGTYADNMRGVANVRVRLDGARETMTDAEGRFSFEEPGSGTHRLETILPAGQAAFFTTRSSFAVEAGDDVRVGLAFAPARLHGFVRSDAGLPIAGVTVKLQRGAQEWVATTTSSGQYGFEVGEGSYRVSLPADAIPEGYDLTLVEEGREVSLNGATPVQADLIVPAHRAISGQVLGGPVDQNTVELVETGQQALADAEGRYLFRNLKPGTYTLAVKRRGKRIVRTVVLPAGPAFLRDVDVGANTAGQ